MDMLKADKAPEVGGEITLLVNAMKNLLEEIDSRQEVLARKIYPVCNAPVEDDAKSMVEPCETPLGKELAEIKVRLGVVLDNLDRTIKLINL